MQRASDFIAARRGKAIRPAWARPVSSWMILGAPLQPPTRRLAGEHALVGGDGMAPAKEKPAGHDGASWPGAALPRSLLSTTCSLLVMSHSCTSTQAKMLHDGM
jgi:hypothetical protein